MCVLSIHHFYLISMIVPIKFRHIGMKINAGYMSSAEYDHGNIKGMEIVCDVIKRLVFKKKEDLDNIKKMIEEEGYPIQFGNTTVNKEIQTLKLKGSDKSIKVRPSKVNGIEKQKKTKEIRGTSIVENMKVGGNKIKMDSMTLSGDAVGFTFGSKE